MNKERSQESQYLADWLDEKIGTNNDYWSKFPAFKYANSLGILAFVIVTLYFKYGVVNPDMKLYNQYCYQILIATAILAFILTFNMIKDLKVRRYEATFYEEKQSESFYVIRVLRKMRYSSNGVSFKTELGMLTLIPIFVTLLFANLIIFEVNFEFNKKISYLHFIAFILGISYLSEKLAFLIKLFVLKGK